VLAHRWCAFDARRPEVRLPTTETLPTQPTRPPHPAQEAEVLDDAFAAWCRLPKRVHALALVVLVALAVTRYADLLADPEAWIDESIYQQGFLALDAGRSPYQHPGFYYPPPFAHAGAFLLARIGAESQRYWLRGLNVLGLVWVIWLAAAWLPAPRADPARGLVLRLAVSIFLLVAPVGVFLGLRVGNISFAIAALALTAICWYPRFPIVSGLLLGLSVAFKPLAPAVLAVLIAQPTHQRAHAAAGRRCALAAVASMAALCLPYAGELRDLFAQQLSTLVEGRILSTYRLVHLLGLPLGRATVFALLTLVLMVFARRYATTHCRVVALALGAVVLTAPALWSHTMTVLDPVLTMASVLAYRNWSRTRARAPGSAHDRAAGSELVLVALGLAAALYFKSGGFDHLADSVQVMFLAPLLLAPLLLTGYVLWASSRALPSP